MATQQITREVTVEQQLQQMTALLAIAITQNGGQIEYEQLEVAKEFFVPREIDINFLPASGTFVATVKP